MEELWTHAIKRKMRKVVQLVQILKHYLSEFHCEVKWIFKKPGLDRAIFGGQQYLKEVR